MSRVKDIRLKVIPQEVANRFIKKHHYSGRFMKKSQLHFGAFLDGVLHGAMSFGPSINRRKTMPLVEGTKWNEFIELHRLAFDDVLPRNSESRCLSVAIRMLKKQAPHLKWILSFADASQCGDGTIYRASGFVLTGIKKNKSLMQMPNGDVIFALSLDPTEGPTPGGGQSKKYGKVGKYASWSAPRFIKHIGGKALEGYQLRYVYFLHPEEIDNLTAFIIPFSKIKEMGIAMYKGEKQSGGSIDSDAICKPAD